ncbi:MAG: hypothetical protein H6747_15530 [Deltaproteobacteria bacterium]|nr:hypothetical protein [Deltaproteobacteria bacterium]
MHRHFLRTLILCAVLLGIGCTGESTSTGSGDATVDSGADAAADASADTAADAAGPECDDAHPCGIGSYCKTGGVCCPALGCAPNCPNGRAVDAKGCETCGCAP